MTTHLRFELSFHVAENALIVAQMFLEDGVTMRGDINSATLKLVDMDDTASVILDDVECEVVDGGECRYTTTVEQLDVSATLGRPMRVLAQYTLLLEDGNVKKTDHVSGVIEANL